MAWPEKMPTKRRNSAGRMADVYRARYWDSAGKKQSVKDANGNIEVFFRKDQARAAAQRAETIAKAQAPTAVSPLGTITWDEWWARIGGNRHEFGNADAKEAATVRKWISPTFGEERLNRISRQMVKDWIQSLIKAGCKPGHIEKIYYLFKWTMNEALETEPPVLQASPCGKKMGLPPVKETPQAYITYEDLKQYRELGFREDFARIIEFNLETGMRPGEIMGMHESQIVWDQGWTEVSNTIVPKPRTIKGFTKTGDTRKVPLTDQALAILAGTCEGRDMTRGCGVPHLDGQPCTSEIVFRSNRGKAIVPDLVTDALTSFQKKHGLPHKTMYAGRRGMITMQITNGTPLAEVSKLVGHSGPRAAEQTMGYFQVTPEARVRVQAARDKAMGVPVKPRVVATRPESTDHETRGAGRGANPGRTMLEDVAS